MGPYGDAAREYWAAGWRGVLPLPARAKTPPPGGFTGWAGIDPSRADVQTWCDGPEAAGNVALRLPGGAYGLDVDDYGGKHGGAALAALEAAHGPLPPTWVVSSRDDGVSGIRLFRAELEPGRRWRDEPAGHGAGIEAIHRGHRYAVVWPSVHPETGRKYMWRRPDGIVTDGTVPAPDDLPELPPAWVEALSELGEIRLGAVAGHDETMETVHGWREGDPCPIVATAYDRAMGGLSAGAAGAALHPAMLAGVHEMVNLAHEGHAGVRRALAEHYAGHLAAREARGEGGGAAAEWWRAVRGAIGKLPGGARAVCDCGLWSGEGLLFEPSGHTGGERTSAGQGAAPMIRSPESPTMSDSSYIKSRRVDLRPFLDGSYRPPEPSRGAERDGGARLLYPGRWHTVVGLTAAGKSWLALVHARDEMAAWRSVVYLHFEEHSPAGTVDRLLAIGAPREAVAERFMWLDCDRMWERGELAHELVDLAPGLVVLDGINAACTRHGFDPGTVEAVGWYRDRFVTPAVAAGAAVLSLGHPPKARDRQDERHGYGSTAWLDECDGVGFRLVASKSPIRRGGSGMANLLSVKDRYGSVERLGRPDGREGWVYLGSLVVDDTGEATKARLSAPEPIMSPIGGPPQDALDELADRVVAHLAGMPDGSYESEGRLGDALRAARVRHTERDLAAALTRLELAGRLVRVPGSRRARGGRLVDLETTASDD